MLRKHGWKWRFEKLGCWDVRRLGRSHPPTILTSQHPNRSNMFDENLSKNIKALAYEKNIDVERVFKALEDALATAARKYYKTREPMETVIDRTSGEMTMYVIKEVVEDENQIEDPQAQWTLEQAKKIDPEVEVNGTIRLS